MMSSERLKSNRVGKAALVAAAATAALAVGGSVRAATIAYWNFNDAVGNTANWLAVDSGTGTMTTTSTNPLTSTTGTTVNAVGATVAGNAIGFESKSNVATPNYIWASSTAGQNDIWFSYASNNSLGGYTTMTVGYSTNGTTFTDLASQSTPGSFAATQVDLSSITALNNNANAKFRLTLSGGSSGNNKFFYIDNVQINSGNDSQITAAASLNLGRVIQNGAGAQNFNLTKTGVLATSYTASGTGLAVTADGSIASGAGTETISVGLANDAPGSATTGLKALSLTIDNTGGTSFGAGLGSADANDTVNVSATVVANRIVSAGSISLGRVMVGQTLGGSSSLSTTGDDNNFTRVTVGTTAAADANGFSISGGTGTLFNSAASTGSRNAGGSFSTSGLKSGSRTLTTTGEGLAGEAPVNVTVNYTGTALANRVVSASSVGFGRVMVGSTLGGTSNLTTTGDDNNRTRVTVGTTAGPDANGVSITGGTGTLFDSAGATGSRGFGGSFSTTGVKTGSITLATTGEGLAGEAAINVPASYIGTALADRIVSASSINFGSVIVGGGVSDTSNLSTTLDDDNATRVTVATTAGPDANSFSITGGTGTNFNGAASTGTRNLAGTVGAAGAISGSLLLTTTGEGLAGEAPINVSIAYSGTGLDHSNGSFATPTDTDTIVLDFGVVAQNSVQSLPFSIHNLVATAGFTAGLDLDSIFETDPDGVFSSDVATFANLAAGGSSAYNVALDTTNVGTFGGSYILSLSDQNLAGATGGQTLTINVVGEVVPEPTSLGLIGAAAMMGLARRRRRNA